MRYQSLANDSVTKAYVANGSDVQGLIDPLQSVPKSFPYPITKVVEGFDATGRRTDDDYITP